MTRRPMWCILLCGLLVAVGRIGAQPAGDLVTQGVSAYRSLEYDAAVTLFRRALAATGTGALSDSARANVGIYLGASEFFRGRRDAAATAFRQALVVDPRVRPDRLVFPPALSSAFDSVRATTAYVHARTPASAVFAPGTFGAYPVTLYASNAMTISVDLVSEQGTILRGIFSGPISDSVEVRWDGLDGSGARPLQGKMFLQVASRGPAGGRRVTRLPLTVAVVGGDTVNYPPAPTPSPSFNGSPRAIASLATGVLAGVTAVALPSLIGVQGKASGARFAVGGALGLAGVLGFLQEGPSRQRSADERDEAARAAWQRQVAAIRMENAQRRREGKLRVTAGDEVVTATGEP